MLKFSEIIFGFTELYEILPFDSMNVSQASTADFSRIEPMQEEVNNVAVSDLTKEKEIKVEEEEEEEVEVKTIVR